MGKADPRGSTGEDDLVPLPADGEVVEYDDGFRYRNDIGEGWYRQAEQLLGWGYLRET